MGPSKRYGNLEGSLSVEGVLSILGGKRLGLSGDGRKSIIRAYFEPKCTPVFSKERSLYFDLLGTLTYRGFEFPDKIVMGGIIILVQDLNVQVSNRWDIFDAPSLVPYGSQSVTFDSGAKLMFSNETSRS